MGIALDCLHAPESRREGECDEARAADDVPEIHDFPRHDLTLCGRKNGFHAE